MSNEVVACDGPCSSNVLARPQRHDQHSTSNQCGLTAANVCPQPAPSRHTRALPGTKNTKQYISSTLIAVQGQAQVKSMPLTDPQPQWRIEGTADSVPASAQALLEARCHAVSQCLDAHHTAMAQEHVRAMGAVTVVAARTMQLKGCTAAAG